MASPPQTHATTSARTLRGTGAASTSLPHPTLRTKTGPVYFREVMLLFWKTEAASSRLQSLARNRGATQRAAAQSLARSMSIRIAEDYALGHYMILGRAHKLDFFPESRAPPCSQLRCPRPVALLGWAPDGLIGLGRLDHEDVINRSYGRLFDGPIERCKRRNAGGQRYYAQRSERQWDNPTRERKPRRYKQRAGSRHGFTKAGHLFNASSRDSHERERYPTLRRSAFPALRRKIPPMRARAGSSTAKCRVNGNKWKQLKSR